MNERPAMNERHASGEGMFETILSRRGHILYLADHLKRLRSSLATIDIRTAFDDDVISARITRHLKAAGLTRGEARVKLTVAREILNEASAAAAPEIFIEARSYDRPDTSKGWRLQLDSSFMATTEARHKSLHYRNYLVRLRGKLEQGFDDAILVNTEGEICETTIAALLLRRGNTWIIPAAEEQLPGIGRAAIVELLRAKGHEIFISRVAREAIATCDEIWACNSLMGAMPVRAVNEQILPESNDALLNHINTRFLTF